MASGAHLKNCILSHEQHDVTLIIHGIAVKCHIPPSAFEILDGCGEGLPTFRTRPEGFHQSYSSLPWIPALYLGYQLSTLDTLSFVDLIYNSGPTCKKNCWTMFTKCSQFPVIPHHLVSNTRRVRQGRLLCSTAIELMLAMYISE